MKQPARFPSLMLLASALSGCGGGSSTTTAIPSPTPSPIVRTLIQEGSVSGLGQLVLASIPFETTTTGTIEATVDWTFAGDNVDIYLGRGSCTIDEFNNGTCNLLTFSESPVDKPERIRSAVQPSGSYTLYIGNRGPQEESVSFQIFLSTGGGLSSTSTTPPVIPVGNYVRMLRRP